MSLAPVYAPEQSSATRTGHQFQLALFIVVGSVLVGCLIYVVERFAFQPRRRFMENPAELMMRAFGIAHFLLGWHFLLCSPRLRSRAALARLGFWTLVGALVCWGYHELGGSREAFVLFGFYALFLVHEVRDECSLARRNGDLPDNAAFSATLAQAVTAGLITVLGTIYLVRGVMVHPDRLPTLPAAATFAGWLVMLAATFALTWRTALVGARCHGSLQAALIAHAPLVAIYRWLFAILIVGSFFGSLGLNLVILLHVCVWLVFVGQQLKAQEGSGRGSRVFVAAHLGLVCVLLVLMAVRVQVWERVGWWSVLLSASSFPYWSLMHICIAFARK
jgi:hypothetical protein